MSIRKAFISYNENHKSLVSKIEETIIPLQEKGLWDDDEFFNDMSILLETKSRFENIVTDDSVSHIVANALFRLADSKPDVDVVKRVIQAFPYSLNYRDSKGRHPIEFCCVSPDDHIDLSSLKYLLTFALEGIKHNVGGDDMRGGLLLSYKNMNILQQFCVCGEHPHEEESVINVMKDLRAHELLKKEDIADQGMLLFASFHPHSTLRFKFLADWDPEALVKKGYGDLPFLHAVIHYYKASGEAEVSRKLAQFGFKQSLKYSLKYYKDLLFQKDDEGQTAFDRALKDFGEKDTMTLVKEVFPESDKFPLLHQVIMHQPEHFNLFASYFPWMCHLRDEYGRTVTQAMLSHGRGLLNKNPMIWTSLQTDQMEEKDPQTTLRPFAAVATGEDCDLNLSYQLLRKHPSVMEVILEQREKNRDLNMEQIEVKGKRKRIGTVSIRQKKICNSPEAS
ncbi:hypothetical protein CTEN210_13279 [Chaetoceros tenuissimus]|uniref:Uncharacterized protein n=1 Tax=Chaetoceros tenuissimus TaxID=426638 RepID=A0AAD3D331_9STRA|nr:hypothetical protein CTEN210_13279 [Chaetoceros tenuissimus]